VKLVEAVKGEDVLQLAPLNHEKGGWLLPQQLLLLWLVLEGPACSRGDWLGGGEAAPARKSATQHWLTLNADGERNEPSRLCTLLPDDALDSIWSTQSDFRHGFQSGLNNKIIHITFGNQMVMVELTRSREV